MSNLTSPALPSSSPTIWQLVRIWHVETLSTVAHLATAHRFVRTSYCVVPASWLQLDEQARFDRLLYVLNLSYGSRNFQSSRSGDPAEMWWVAIGFEMVEERAMAARATTRDDDEHVFVRKDRDIHPDVIQAAADQIHAEWAKPRGGLDAMPWSDAFSAFRFEQDGDTCHLVKHRERAAVFDAAFPERQRQPWEK